MLTRNEHLLVCAAEEANEVAQRITKALRFGLTEVQEGQPLTNADRIRYEYMDLVTVLSMLERETGQALVSTDADGWAIHAADKEDKVEKYMRLAEREGTLQPTEAA